MNVLSWFGQTIYRIFILKMQRQPLSITYSHALLFVLTFSDYVTFILNTRQYAFIHLEPRPTCSNQHDANGHYRICKRRDQIFDTSTYQRTACMLICMLCTFIIGLFKVSFGEKASHENREYNISSAPSCARPHRINVSVQNTHHSNKQQTQGMRPRNSLVVYSPPFHVNIFRSTRPR